jgi:hypothetical protein
MAKEKEGPKKLPPATTPEGRENQLIVLAIDLAEKQLVEGTASSQVISHFLKLGSTKERLEKEMIQSQRELIQAKTENIKSSKKSDALFANALNAMRSYSGREEEYEDEE